MNSTFSPQSATDPLAGLWRQPYVCLDECGTLTWTLGGRPFDGSCVRFRYLSIDPPNRTVDRLVNDHDFTVLNKPSGKATILVSKDQQSQLSVGTNENLTTQIDGVIPFKSNHTFETEQFIDRTSAVSSISQITPGIEYGICSSGRQG